MRRAVVILLSWFFLATAAYSQSNSSDTQVTQALLNEVRQLRQDLHVTAIAIQRVQIVMYRLQAQAQVVNRATQRLDEARGRCNQAQQEQRATATYIEQNESKLRDTQNPIEQKGLGEAIARMKASLTVSSAAEQNCRPIEADADSALRVEQAKMNALQDQLDKLDKTLASLSGQ